MVFVKRVSIALLAHAARDFKEMIAVCDSSAWPRDRSPSFQETSAQQFPFQQMPLLQAFLRHQQNLVFQQSLPPRWLFWRMERSIPSSRMELSWKLALTVKFRLSMLLRSIPIFSTHASLI